MAAVWRIEMLGTLRAVREDTVVTRFRTRRVTLLLADLAFRPGRAHAREEMGERLWPEADPEAMRRNLRQALSSLRRVLEPPPIPSGAILGVEQSRLWLNPELVVSDVAEFEAAIDAARRRPGTSEEIVRLEEAVGLYGGELLPGFAEEWILHEQRRLDDLFLGALRRLTGHSRAAGRGEETLRYLRLALARDPLNEEWHVGLMREQLALDRPSGAIEGFGVLKHALRRHLGCDPSETAYDLLNRARRALRSEARTHPDPDTTVIAATAMRIEETDGAEVATATDADDAPPPQIVRLPIGLTRFLGREREIETTLAHLSAPHARLTTLVGPAGAGKTRLAVEIARRRAERHPGHVWFVPLADLSSADAILDAVLDAIRARRSPHRDPIDNLREATRVPLSDAAPLLILDNLEHIQDDAVPIVAEILARVPDVQLLVTTRRVLRLEAEHLVPVAPLPAPTPDAVPSAVRETIDADEVARIAGFPSVQLFLDRCRSLRPDFGLTVHNARAVAAICARLEGLPLAIELAAGLSGAFTPGQMLYHLDRRLTALTSRKRDTPARHRSLAAAVAYSYETLTPELRRLFAALSVFRGGFGVEAAVAVGLDATHSHPHGLELLLELQERSLLYAEHAEGGEDDGEDRELRFRMLESFREVGEEHLGEEHLGDETEGVRRRHAAYYRAHPRPVERTLSPAEGAARHLWIEAEFDNYVAAIEFSLAGGEIEVAIGLLGTLRTTWTSRGPREVERRLIRGIADLVERDEIGGRTIDPAVHIDLLRMLGTTHIRVSEYAAAYAACERALEVARRSGREEGIAVALSALSTCAGFLGRLDECLALNERVLALVPEENLVLRERAHLGSGAVHWGRGDLERAEHEYRRAAEISTRLHGGEIDTLLLTNLARVAMDAGRFDEAMTRLGEAMRISRRVHDEFGLAVALSLVSRYHWLKGQSEAARSTGREALVRMRACDFYHFSLAALFQQALILVEGGEFASGATLLAATGGMNRAARAIDARDESAAQTTLRAGLTPAAYERAWARGLTMNTDEAFRLALAPGLSLGP